MTTLHLVRANARPAGLQPGDWIIELGDDRRELLARATPPIAPGPITYDQLVDLIFSADRVITW